MGTAVRQKIEVYHKTHDAAGRLVSVGAGSFSSGITWDGFGRKATVQHSDGGGGTFQYDHLSRIKSIQWSGGSSGGVSEQLTYDLAGNITNIQRENGSYTVAYDAIDQIVSSSTTGSASDVGPVFRSSRDVTLSWNDRLAKLSWQKGLTQKG